jgi:hypothetical protein
MEPRRVYFYVDCSLVDSRPLGVCNVRESILATDKSKVAVLKGTVARDFRSLVFFMNGPNKDA